MQVLTPGFVEQWSTNVKLVLQQEKSLLRKCVRNEELEHESKFFFEVNTLEALDRNKDANGYNYADIIADRSPEMYRKQLNCHMVYWNAVFDRGDVTNTFLDPKSYFAKSATAALGRKYDQMIINAFTADVPGKQPGANNAYQFNYTTNAVPLTKALNHDADGNLNFVEHPGNLRQDGLTIDKLLQAREKLSRVYGQTGEKFYLACTSTQIADLLTQDKVINADYSTVRALATGEVDSFLGFKFIITEMLPGYIGRGLNGNPAHHANTKLTIRSCFAFAESAMIFARTPKLFLSKVDERIDKHYSIQFYCGDSAGAVRMNDKGVALIHCAEPYTREHLLIPGINGIRGANLVAWNTFAKDKGMITTNIVAP